MRYDPETDRVERSPFVLPHNPQFQTGWHSVFYDVAAAPGGESVFAVTWIAQPRLMRIWPNEGAWPRVEDLGAATQDRDPSIPMDTFADHCGGLVFAGDGQLYYVASPGASGSLQTDRGRLRQAGTDNCSLITADPQRVSR